MTTMHLFGIEAGEEKPLCGAHVPFFDLIGVDYYLESGGRKAFRLGPPARIAKLRWFGWFRNVVRS